jgi:predicted DNA-binding transcriptional regulator AlpA
MSKRKADVVRSFPPDHCSRETLAYRLDCSPDSIDRLVADKFLPPPQMIGSMKRWDWQEVVAWIRAHNGKLGDFAELPNGQIYRTGDEDPFSAGIANVKASVS